jgi:hypothetical protein
VRSRTLSRPEVPAWDVVASGHRERWASRLRRWIVVTAAAVLIAVGVVNVSAQVLRWLRPTAGTVSSPAVTDIEFTGAATVAAVDYASWDENDKPARQTALTRMAAPGISLDGWGGAGRQWADSPAVIGLVRTDAGQAVVTVRLRLVPFVLDATAGAPAPAPASVSDAGANVAAAPVLQSRGWTAKAARWMNLAVPVASQGDRIVVTSSPVPVGSPPLAAQSHAAVGRSSSGDAAFAQSTRDTVTTLLRSYGTSDLAYGRASGTSFAGLGNAATLDTVSEWRVAEVHTGQDNNVRVGDATVTWALSGGAGTLTATYRVELRRADDRWYLASLSAEIEAVR